LMPGIVDARGPPNQASTNHQHRSRVNDVTSPTHGGLLRGANVNRSPRQTAATREAQAAVWRRAGGLVGLLHLAFINALARILT
jgi:hypothetical protein